ncbi:MAG: 5'/3'-nucleotidase SurE [Nitrospinaceae bacterium]|nr:5'/3'-nucleotidase SurE [Nitrospina sp.]MBT5869322.1 5'/3'-nucleotidase SurE [Nitrospinaceae bacterium]MBT6345654.1 5'/3'-nucleotidase SurE [Nitrospina sp.]
MILLCNDDGFNADGLRALYHELSQEDDVIIVAPETEQSAMGHAITLSQPLKVRKVVEEGKFIGYAVNGTPADCVKLAIAVLLDEPPRLVVSGINLGGNLGICALYSGTVSAATEAMIMGVPSIAVSLDTYEDPDFSPAAKFIRKLIPTVMKKGLPQGVVLNVNVPPVPEAELAGVAITRQGKSRVVESFDKRADPRNNTYYWMAGEMRFDEVEDGADCVMVSKNYISVTPIHFDLTHYASIDEIKGWKL